MTNRILPMGFSAMMMTGLLGGCGQPMESEQTAFMCPKADTMDYDGDGVEGSILALDPKYEQQMRDNSCEFPNDWCPTYPGPAERHGCPADTLGTKCFTREVSNRQLLSVDVDRRQNVVYPELRFCLHRPEDALQVGTQRDWKEGLWVNMDPNLPIAADAFRQNKPTTVTWTKKNGASGTVDGVGAYDSRPVSRWMLLPVDGTLATLEINDPTATLWLWTMGGEKIPCTERNASGGPVCRF